MKKLLTGLVFVLLLAIPVFIFLFRAPSEHSLWQVYKVIKVAKDDFRALEVEGAEVYAASKNGQFVYSTDTGSTWNFVFVDSMEFRSIALTQKHIYLASAGSPTRIYQSPRAALSEVNFTLIYERQGPDWFIDAAKSDSKGNVWFFGDVRREYDTISQDTQYVSTLLLRSVDGEMHSKHPPMNSRGEYGFAAGNSCLEVRGDTLSMVTGGEIARWFTSVNSGEDWTVQVLPYVTGPSKGAFGIALPNQKGVIVGGDYAADSLNVASTFYTRDGGTHWFPSNGVNGYLSDVEYLGESAFMATGTKGTCWTVNGGQTWEFIDETPFNTLETDQKGRIWLAGPEYIGRVVLRQEFE